MWVRRSWPLFLPRLRATWQPPVESVRSRAQRRTMPVGEIWVQLEIQEGSKLAPRRAARRRVGCRDVRVADALGLAFRRRDPRRRRMYVCA